jgi:hypothetical protein
MTSNEVLCEFTTLTILKNNAEETRARVLAGQGVHNLALKAKVVYKQEDVEEEEVCEREYWSPEDAKYALNEHLALTTNAFWDANKHKFKGSKFKPSPRKSSDSKVRHCYNCRGIKHLIAHSQALVFQIFLFQEAWEQGQQEEMRIVVSCLRRV